MTRSRSRKLTQVIGGLVKRSWKQEECLVKAWKVILLHFGELPTTKEPLDKEGAVWIRFPQAREAGDRLVFLSVLGIIEVSGYVCCLFFCGWVYLRFSGGNMDMKHESSGVVKIQEENKWVWPRWVKTALGSCEIWSNQVKGEPLMERAADGGQTASKEGAKRKKGRLRRRSKAQIRRGRCWKRSILSGYQEFIQQDVDIKETINKEVKTEERWAKWSWIVTGPNGWEDFESLTRPVTCTLNGSPLPLGDSKHSSCLLLFYISHS
ncbi:hypothetical protein IGI04_042676 [Brassica rapa subsp. trilocularis]|uniref:DUF4283 domain-containing protein n=1 Tax=Brassica rapa subsp. trilocularis TaxID=1813537 RepID=A0ABQ7KKE3_BRACM|nr:hypothetical protein IGI04_042676 [Brassica rapa subsp. trilocularis]